MSISAVGGVVQPSVQGLLQMRRDLDELQRQLGTGKKSASYAELGLTSGLGVALRAQLSSIAGYDQTAGTVGVRLDVAQTALTRMSALNGEAKAALLQQGVITSSGQAAVQTNARNQLDELLSLLNSSVEGRYLFSGRSVDQMAVASAAQVLDGDGARAGLKQIIAERRQADLGAAGLGRLTVSSLGSAMTVSEDVAGSPFGFKLAAASTDIPGAGITGPAGAPPAVTVSFGPGNVQPGESVSFSLTLPDGSTETVRLTATTASPPGADAFTIGTTPAASAANLQAALGTRLASLAGTALVGASAMAAAGDFFQLDAGQTPQRVAGPPFDSATSLVAATAADTVFWYTGEISSDTARKSVNARIDDGLSVSYGMRANEQGIRALVQNVAVFAATTFPPGDASSPAAYTALVERLRPALEGAPQTQKVADIAADIGSAQALLATARERQQQMRSVLSGLLDKSEGISTEEVAAKVLTLQTRLQASLQTTAIMSRLNLANYL